MAARALRQTASRGKYGARPRLLLRPKKDPRVQLSKEINGKMSFCRSIEQVIELVDKYEADFTHVQAALAIITAARVVRPFKGRKPIPAKAMERLMGVAMPHFGQYTQTELAKMAACFNEMLQQPLADLSIGTRYFQTLLDNITPHLPTFSPRGLADVLWAMGRLHISDPPFVSKLLPNAVHKVRMWAPDEVCRSALSLSLMRHHDPDFLQLLKQELKKSNWKKLNNISPAGAAAMLRALAVTGTDDERFVKQLLPRVIIALGHKTAADLAKPVKRVAVQTLNISSEQLCEVMYALSMLDYNPSTMVPPLLAAIARLQLSKRPGLTPDQLAQVHQYLVLTEAAGHIQPEELSKEYGSSWAGAKARAEAGFWSRVKGYQLTGVEREVEQAAAALPGCRDAVRTKAATPDLLLWVHVALQLADGTQVALEVETADAFMSNQTSIAAHTTLWRYRMLQERGFKVVRVSEADWRALGASQQQQEHLRTQLQESGVVLPKAFDTFRQRALGKQGQAQEEGAEEAGEQGAGQRVASPSDAGESKGGESSGLLPQEQPESEAGSPAFASPAPGLTASAPPDNTMPSSSASAALSPGSHQTEASAEGITSSPSPDSGHAQQTGKPTLLPAAPSFFDMPEVLQPKGRRGTPTS